MSIKLATVSLLAISFPASAFGSTLAQWRAKPPAWQTTSTRTLADLEGCLGSNWAGTLSLKMVPMPIERGMQYSNDGMNRDILVDLVDEGDHRSIRMWLRSYFGIKMGSKEHIEKLTACAQAR